MINVNNTQHPDLKQFDDNTLITKFLSGTEQKKRLLERLSINEVAILSPKFHDLAKKDKLLTPSQLGVRVRFALSKKHPKLVQYLDFHKLEAHDFAAYVLMKVNLPAEAQRTIKQKQKEKYSKEAMATKEPTRKQLEFLAELGFKGQVQTRLEASDAITKLKGEQK